MENIDQVFDENITSTGCSNEHKMDGILYHRDFIILNISQHNDAYKTMTVLHGSKKRWNCEETFS